LGSTVRYSAVGVDSALGVGVGVTVPLVKVLGVQPSPGLDDDVTRERRVPDLIPSHLESRQNGVKIPLNQG